MGKLQLPDRVQSKVMPVADGCWLWTAAVDGQGYGKLTVDSRTRSAHRLVYELLVGRIPDGLELDHLCRQPSCVNPRHLEAVTRAENVRRGLMGNGSTCRNGLHAWPESRVVHSGRGRCGPCIYRNRRKKHDGS